MNQNITTINQVTKTPMKASDKWQVATSWAVAIAATATAIVVLGHKMAEKLISLDR